MNLDVEDVIASVIGEIFGRVFLFLIAIGVGGIVGALAIHAGAMADGRHGWNGGGWQLFYWFSPWALLNVPFLLGSLLIFIRNDRNSYFLWGLVVAVESILLLLGWVYYREIRWLPLSVAIVTCLTVLVMVETGVWLLRQHLIHLWARDLAMLRAENAQRRAARESEERRVMQLEGLAFPEHADAKDHEHAAKNAGQ